MLQEELNCLQGLIQNLELKLKVWGWRAQMHKFIPFIQNTQIQKMPRLRQNEKESGFFSEGPHFKWTRPFFLRFALKSAQFSWVDGRRPSDHPWRRNALYFSTWPAGAWNYYNYVTAGPSIDILLLENDWRILCFTFCNFHFVQLWGHQDFFWSYFFSIQGC